MSAPVSVELDDPDLWRVVDGRRQVDVGQFDDFVETVVQRDLSAGDFERGNRLDGDAHKQTTKDEEKLHFFNFLKKHN